MAKYDVFISYSRKNSEIVNEVTHRLRSAGLIVWIDEDGIESGDLFKRVITNAIENSACVLFFSSYASNNSTWTAKEIGIAIYEGIPVIPVILDATKYNPEIKFDLVNRDYVNMQDRADYEKSIARIIKAIKKIVLNSNHEDSVISEHQNVKSFSSPYQSATSKEGSNLKTSQETSHGISDSIKNLFRNIGAHIVRHRYVYLLVLSMLFCYIGLIIYALAIVLYMERKRKKGKEVPEFYRKHRKWIIAATCGVYSVILTFVLCLTDVLYELVGILDIPGILICTLVILIFVLIYVIYCEYRIKRRRTVPIFYMNHRKTLLCVSYLTVSVIAYLLYFADERGILSDDQSFDEDEEEEVVVEEAIEDPYAVESIDYCDMEVAVDSVVVDEDFVYEDYSN